MWGLNQQLDELRKENVDLKKRLQHVLEIQQNTQDEKNKWEAECRIADLENKRLRTALDELVGTYDATEDIDDPYYPFKVVRESMAEPDEN